VHLYSAFFFLFFCFAYFSSPPLQAPSNNIYRVAPETTVAVQVMVAQVTVVQVETMVGDRVAVADQEAGINMAMAPVQVIGTRIGMEDAGLIGDAVAIGKSLFR
jgi:hypothetical protein